MCPWTFGGLREEREELFIRVEGWVGEGSLKPLLLAEEQLTVGDSQSERVGLKNLAPKQGGDDAHL